MNNEKVASLWADKSVTLNTKTASESRETESCPEASSHGYWIHQLDTRKTARVNFTYVWPTLLRKLNHKYELWILLCKCYEYFLFFPSYQLANVLIKIYNRHHSRALHCYIAHVAIPAATFLNSMFTSNVRFCWYQIVSCAVHCSAA